MKTAAVLFDLDGTLLNTLAGLADCMNRVLGHWNFPTHATDAYRRFIGDGMENLVRRSLPEEARHDRAISDACVAAMKAEYGRRGHEGTHPYKDVPELLDALAARSLKLAVLSNKPHEFTCRMVREHLPSWSFEPVMGERPGIPRKPHPGSALHIAHSLGISPDCFLYLGDTGTDMQTAREAGMFAVGATWGYRSEEELLADGAQVLIDAPLELLKHVRNCPENCGHGGHDG